MVLEGKKITAFFVSNILINAGKAGKFFYISGKKLSKNNHMKIKL